MTIKKRSIDIVQPKYHPSAKPEENASSLTSDDVVMLLEKSKRSQTKMPNGSLVPQPDAKPTDDQAAASETPPRRWRPLKVIIGLVALTAAVYFGVQAGSRLFDAWADLKPVTSNEASPPSDTNSADANTAETAAAPTVTETPPTAAPVAAPAPTAPLSVKVLNGNGRAGDAGKVKEILEKAGITVAATGNAKSFGYATTVVYYVSGKKDAADKVVAALSGYEAAATENAVAEGYDALVVIGAK